MLWYFKALVAKVALALLLQDCMFREMPAAPQHLSLSCLKVM